MHRIPASLQMPDAEDWPRLTASDRKRALFAEDLYFRACWADLHELAGPGAAGLLGDVALLSFKCDGLIGRRMRPTVDYLHAQGFVEVGSARIRHNRHSIRELWRYNWHVYPTDRLALMSAMHTATESLLLILRDTRYDGVLPASVRIADLKGSASPEKRQPHHLRSVLRPPNAVINFVHVADEPADVVREVGIFLDRRERRRLLGEVVEHLASGQTISSLTEIDKLEAEYEAHDLDLANSLDRVQAGGRVSTDDVARLRAAAGGNARWLSWEQLTAILDPADPHTNLWDFVCIATAVLPAEREGLGDLLPATTAAEWLPTQA